MCKEVNDNKLRRLEPAPIFWLIIFANLEFLCIFYSILNGSFLYSILAMSVGLSLSFFVFILLPNTEQRFALIGTFLAIYSPIMALKIPSFIEENRIKKTILQTLIYNCSVEKNIAGANIKDGAIPVTKFEVQALKDHLVDAEKMLQGQSLAGILLDYDIANGIMDIVQKRDLAFCNTIADGTPECVQNKQESIQGELQKIKNKLPILKICATSTSQ